MKLTTIHNSGLFSCFTIALQDIMKHYNYHGSLPDEWDRHQQYIYYKSSPTESLIPMLFRDDYISSELPLPGMQYFMTNDNSREQQYTPYKELRFDDLRIFRDMYFSPGEMVTNRIYDFKRVYNIDPENTVAVFHRANDKVRETSIMTDDDWISKMREGADGGKMLVIPDNTEFAERCRAEFPDCVIIKENHLYPSDSGASNFMKVPLSERPQHALNFFASVLIASKCKTLITHSGNGGFWSAVYRGHGEGIIQSRDNCWI